ncbi:helicase-associated domain-containing protein [Paenibacillus sp. LHD-117]|uniref:DNA repair helicase XPB n=1 Tax=Paenibacillus sp. LHD-117 TaxID=3071412 RepID=UPI0027DEC5AC|nr:DNA repair helicase XPB [Paenibacillus sp. LHD-117]MDQ6420849.1 helicase-associated domain-containing protein [Paenibacillus sp. LHD-117]
MERAIIVQSDLTVLLDERSKNADNARELLHGFAELVKRTGEMHAYRITPITIWNALSAGGDADTIVQDLEQHARYGLPLQASASIRLWAGRYGKLQMFEESGRLILSGNKAILGQLERFTAVTTRIKERISAERWELIPESRGDFKQELTRLGFPVLDHAGYRDGEALSVQLRAESTRGRVFAMRSYQMEALDRFLRNGSVQGGSGVVVLPCGTGKTVVGLAALTRLGAETLILTSSVTSAQQWMDELLDKTTLTEAQIGLYCGSFKQVRPVTISTYTLLTHRKSKNDGFANMNLFSERDWGLIIYDEVHLLPAPVFRMTASLQATRRLGLTATLVREDGCAEDVYSLIGPKLFDMEWKKAEAGAFISVVNCAEIRVRLHDSQTADYAESGASGKLRIAAENRNKLPVVRELLGRHEGKPTLIIGQYLNQLHQVAQELDAPLLTGEVSQEERSVLYDRFKQGDIQVLVVSKIANLAVDLPDAAVAIQLSGSFGSRQEEAQRIGRLLRPKQGNNEAWFYTLVTDGTKETEFALKRQLFMMEQGYMYERQKLSDEERSVADLEGGALRC